MDTLQSPSVQYVDIEDLKWTDSKWMKDRETWDHNHEPVSIYEAHIGSWKRHPREEEDGFYTYREFAHEAAAYIKEMGSAYSNNGAPSKFARPCASFGKCAGTQSRITPIFSCGNN